MLTRAAQVSALTQVSYPTHPLWISHHTALCGGLGLRRWNWFGSCALYASTRVDWAVYQTLCEGMSLEEKKGMKSHWSHEIMGRKWNKNCGPHLGYRSLHRTLSYPRSSWQSLYWARWRSRPLSVYWSSESLLVHPLCHLKTRLLCPAGTDHQTLTTEIELG